MILELVADGVTVLLFAMATLGPISEQQCLAVRVGNV